MTKRVGKLSYDQKKILGRGSYGTTVFYGCYRESFFGAFGAEKQVAVKRIQRSDLHSDYRKEVEIMRKAAYHPNILRCICTEMTENFLFIAVELCRGTLEDYLNETYVGPMLKSEREILRQVSQGLAHLHSLNIIHRNIKPTDILIFVPDESTGNEPQMKLADFGFSKILNIDKEDFTNTNVTNPSGTKGWMAPEVYEVNRFDFKIDIWSLGCIFGYTLSGGKHPFGNDPDRRVVLIKDKEPILLVQSDLLEPYSNNCVAFDLIKSMLRIEYWLRPTVGEVLNHEFFMHKTLGKGKSNLPAEAEMVTLGKNIDKTRIRNDIKSTSEGLLRAFMSAGSGWWPPEKMVRAGDRLSYNPQKKIGRGAISIIFEGVLEEGKGEKRVVAVKRFQTSDVDDVVVLREVELMMKARDHPNILRCLYTIRTDNFVFIAMELCQGTLEQMTNGTYDGPTIEDKRKIIYQVTQGLAHLHRNKIIHRDIKPKNILIYIPDGGQPLIKLADFGLSKVLNIAQDDFTNTNVGNPSGTRGWMAPELYRSRRYDSKVDIFALGCIFGYTLSDGKHPFGDDPFDRSYRVKHMLPIVMNQQDLTIPYSRDGIAYNLILSMVEMDPANRPTVDQVLKSTFFLPCLE